MCIEKRMGYFVCVTGFAVCAAVSVACVALPGWAVKRTGENEQTLSYAGLFWTCFNGSFEAHSCEPGRPFWDSALDTTTKFLVSVGAGFQVLGVGFAVYHHCCTDSMWTRRSPVVQVFAIGGGLIFFVGSLCGVAFVEVEGQQREYVGGPVLFLGLTSSCLVVNFGCLINILNRQPETDL